MGSVSILPSFNHLVAEALAEHGFIKLEKLIVLDNSSKYDPDGMDHVSEDVSDREALGAIFECMADLNRTAVQSPTLCAGDQGISFRDALHASTDQLVRLINNRPVRYVELGPEPWKSSTILSKLLGAGVTVRQYIGVDINPESEELMRRELESRIGADKFSYWVRNFYEASADEHPPLPPSAQPRQDNDDYVTVITNLGFQEGNDLPSRIGSMLARLTRPGDLLLSEMQVCPSKITDLVSTTCIQEFYLQPEMRRFSALVRQRAYKGLSGSPSQGNENDTADEYLYKLVPLQTEVGMVNVATTLMSVMVQGIKKYILTNSCLKYTLDQFVRAREMMGDFAVRAVEETGDKSVVFQVAERL
ncbi:hypothetical protein CDD83_3471 [Cordyceps sp. RAO-2017]|nr:hypothetical protein CDD83_3471 [Cordyceps sp. RAO-2017]